jgi:crotonobetainyl-CoA:carnitine CoA-transferase CaiB-like acyl-CoA transferase
VVVESYRPGTVERWDLGEERLRATNPGLVWCSLSAFGRDGGDRIGHDLNFVAASGALEMLGGDVPGLQLADVGAGLLAATSILAALLERGRTGRGRRIDQPLAGGVAPFMVWAWVEDAAGAEGDRPVRSLLNGGCPAYRLYGCSDGAQLAVAALEPKLWLALVNALGLPELAGAGLDVGADGEAAAARLASRFAERPRDAWIADPAFAGLPMSPVHGVAAARREPTLELAGVIRDGRPAPWISSFSPAAGGRAPQLGADTESIRAEVGDTLS